MFSVSHDYQINPFMHQFAEYAVVGNLPFDRLAVLLQDILGMPLARMHVIHISDPHVIMQDSQDKQICCP